MAGARPDTWMPMFWGDYLKDTGHLSTLEHGAYLLLIGHYWSSGAPLPDDDAKLRRIAKIETPAQWRKVRPVVAEFFKVGGGIWRHGRIDLELGVALKRSTDAKTKAEKAAKARWQPPSDDIPETEHGAYDDDASGNPSSIAKSTPTSMPGAMLEQCPPQPQSSSPSPTVVETPIVAAAAFDAVRATEAAATADDQQSVPESRQPVDPPAEPDDQPDDLAIPQALRANGPRAAKTRQFLADEAFTLWSPVAFELGISDIGYLNRDRRAALNDRLVEIGGIDGWKRFLEKVREARFLRKPDGKPKFWVGLGKLLEPETFAKLMEDRFRDADCRETAAPQETAEQRRIRQGKEALRA